MRAYNMPHREKIALRAHSRRLHNAVKRNRLAPRVPPVVGLAGLSFLRSVPESRTFCCLARVAASSSDYDLLWTILVTIAAIT